MNKMAKTYWVWTELTESLRGIEYPAHEERKAGQPVWEYYLYSCPRTWVEKGYVKDATEVKKCSTCKHGVKIKPYNIHGCIKSKAHACIHYDYELWKPKEG